MFYTLGVLSAVMIHIITCDEITEFNFWKVTFHMMIGSALFRWTIQCPEKNVSLFRICFFIMLADAFYAICMWLYQLRPKRTSSFDFFEINFFLYTSLYFAMWCGFRMSNVDVYIGIMCIYYLGMNNIQNTQYLTGILKTNSY